MAIVKMRKLNLIAMSYDKDAILNALQRTNAVEVALHTDTENTITLECEKEGLREYLASTEAALSMLSTAVENCEKEENGKSTLLKDGFEVSYSEFMSVANQKEKVDGLVEKINALADSKNALKVEIAALARSIASANIYASLTEPFSAFGDTAHTIGRLGTISPLSVDNLFATLDNFELSAYKVCAMGTEQALIHVSAHKSVTAEIEAVLSSFGFSTCPYNGEEIGEKVYADLLQKEEGLKAALKENEDTMYALKEEIRLLKVYCEYLLFALEKAETSDKLRTTKKTFLLQAYVPEPAEEQVKQEIKEVSDTVYFEFSNPAEDENPPTLLKNNGIVSNFESITNTYSAPNYREFDPNAVMAFFYSLFMGFIIGDAGYGLLMALIGGYLWLKNRAKPTGLSRLAGAFAVGGLFAIFWGLLFNSVFGLSVLSKTFMPNPQEDMWLLAGISVPSVLIISMVIGVFQIFVGYICRTVQEWRRGNIADGICDGILWAIFSVGVGLAIVGFVEEANMPILATVGGATAGISLLLAMLTAGRKEKFFGKFTKGFGAVYGVINYASDILSYARLYGLMLSGAVIAQIIAQYSTQFITSGNIALIVLGIVILLIGHGFNLVMNLLGAYIHDARLQYVEFYGRFFEGEGELFRPLGSERKYISIS